MICLSIDRIAQIYNYEVPEGIESNDYSSFVISSWVDEIRAIITKHIPKGLELRSNGNAYSVQFSYEKNGELPEPIMNVSAQQYVDGIRLDFNPKRVRDNDWLKSVILEIKKFATNGSYKVHNTQIDLAIDLFNEGALASNFKIVKSGLKRTGLYHAVNGDIQTQYYGVRGSSSYVRIYNKHDEQVSRLAKKYRFLKARALRDYQNLFSNSSLSHPTSDNIVEIFKDYNFNSGPFSSRDFTNIDEFKSALDWSLGQLRKQEQISIPNDWKRFEIVLRTEKLSNNKITFDDKSVYDYLNAIVNTELSSISDYHLRALALAIEDGQVQVSELTQNEKSRYRKILKFSEIVIFKTVSSGAQRIMSIDDFRNKIDPSKVVSEKHITKNNDNTLRDKIKKAFENSKEDLKAELISYTL